MIGWAEQDVVFREVSLADIHWLVYGTGGVTKFPWSQILLQKQSRASDGLIVVNCP